LQRAQLLEAEGYSVLPITVRAHGDSTGDFNDLGYSARHDIVAAVEFLESRRPGRPIFLHGASLGVAAATFASGDLGSRVSGYILEAPYDHLKAAVRNRTSAALPTGLEWVAYKGLLIVSPMVLPDLDKISPLEAIGGVPDDVPVLLIAGRHDVKARPEQVGALFRRVRSHGRFVVFEGAGHLHFQEADPELYRSTVLTFLEEATARQTASRRRVLQRILARIRPGGRG
jgi:alpha-beta hydrolase superfamily lysophospholipase